MNIIRQRRKAKLIKLLFVAICGSVASQNVVAIDNDLAMTQVKAMVCKDNLTIDQTLEQSIKSNSQRDAGWRAFQQEGYVDVERAILVSKATELRYRWRVSDDGSVLAGSERAEKLCRAN